MGVFYVLLLVPIIMQHFVLKKIYIDYEKKNKRALAFFFAFFTALAMFRHETVGNDTQNYIFLFKQISLAGWKNIGISNIEIGYTYLNKIVSLFTKEPQVFLVISSILTIAMIYPTYKRLCLDASLTIVLFCTMSTFLMMFSGIRQMLAIGLGFIAYEFARNKKLIPFILIVFFAMTFHISAFMLLFMYPLYHATITKKWIFVIAPIMAVMFIFNERIFFFLLLILTRFTEYEGEITSTGAYTMLFLFMAFVVFSFIISDESRIDKETIGLRNFLLFSCLIQFFAPLNAWAMRMNYYYIIFIPLLIPKIISGSTGRWKVIGIIGRYTMLLFFLVYFFLNANNNKGLHVFPYHFFWEVIS